MGRKYPVCTLLLPFYNHQRTEGNNCGNFSTVCIMCKKQTLQTLGSSGSFQGGKKNKQTKKKNKTVSSYTHVGLI